MAKKVFILTIPGIGTKDTGYSKGLAEDIENHARGTVLENNWRILELKPFVVTEIDENQRSLFDRLEASNQLGLLKLRQFVMEAFGDGVTFERESGLPDRPYQRILAYFKSKFEEANALMSEYEDSCLVIVAASLGVHLLSCYIWDADHGKSIFSQAPAGPQNNLRNLSFLATIGCNIPLFVSGLRETQIKAFDRRNADFTWDNYYDAEDILGWPLKQISPSYDAMVNDYQINTGPFVGSHVKYWDDKDFTRPFFERMLEMVKK